MSQHKTSNYQRVAYFQQDEFTSLFLDSCTIQCLINRGVKIVGGSGKILKIEQRGVQISGVKLEKQYLKIGCKSIKSIPTPVLIYSFSGKIFLWHTEIIQNTFNRWHVFGNFIVAKITLAKIDKRVGPNKVQAGRKILKN